MSDNPIVSVGAQEKMDRMLRAQRKLAAMMLVHLDADVSPQKVGDFLRFHWRDVSALAHIIHGTNGGCD